MVLWDVIDIVHRWFSNSMAFNWSSHYLNGLVQDCSDSSALALELLQSCTKPSIWTGADLSSIKTWQTIHMQFWLA